MNTWQGVVAIGDPESTFPEPRFVADDKGLARTRLRVGVTIAIRRELAADRGTM